MNCRLRARDGGGFKAKIVWNISHLAKVYIQVFLTRFWEKHIQSIYKWNQRNKNENWEDEKSKIGAIITTRKNCHQEKQHYVFIYL